MPQQDAFTKIQYEPSRLAKAVNRLFSKKDQQENRAATPAATEDPFTKISFKSTI